MPDPNGGPLRTRTSDSLMKRLNQRLILVQILDLANSLAMNTDVVSEGLYLILDIGRRHAGRYSAD